MRKPKNLVTLDALSDNPNDGWIYTKIVENRYVKVDYQGNIQTKDVWISDKDAERLGKRLIKYAQWIRKKRK